MKKETFHILLCKIGRCCLQKKTAVHLDRTLCISKAWLYRKGCQCVLLAAMMVFCTQFSYSQSSGKLTGTITDEASNQPISGVSIVAKKTKQGVSSITDGTYILGLRAGTYTITYSVVGYKTKEITDVSIKSGETNYLNIIMQSNVESLQGVTVTTSIKKEVQSALYSAQKRSAAASDGISQEAIRKTPDNNAGQVLRRVVGLNVQDNRFVVVRGLNDQYNQTTLNGVPMTSTETNRNAFAFNLIPAVAIDNITVNKTATPDMPGNFAGGIVQINTRDFPAKDFLSLTLQPSFTDGTIGKDFYSDKRNKLSSLALLNRDLLLPSDFPTSSSQAPIWTLNQQERIKYLKELPNNLAPQNDGPVGLNETFQVGYGKTIKLKNGTQFGIIAALNQRKIKLIEQETSARDLLFSRNFQPDTITTLKYYSQNLRYNYSADFGGVANFALSFGRNKLTLKNLYSQTLSNLFISRPLVRFSNNETFNEGDYLGVSHVVEFKRLLNTVLAGEHRTGENNETRLDWNVNATLNNTVTPDTRTFIFKEVDSTLGLLRASGDVTYQNALGYFSRSWSSNKDIIYGGAFNIAAPFKLLNNKHLFKSGILFQNRVRNATGTVIPLTNFPVTTLGNVLSPSNYSPFGTDVILSIFAAAGTSSNYQASTALLAAYESVENKFGKKWRIIWGLRMENYQQSIAVISPIYQRGFQDFISKNLDFGARTTFNFLPSINVVYSVAPTINIRSAYSRTVIRPELKDLAPFYQYDFANFQLTRGNESLKSASVSNYDLKVEWFPTSGEIISISAFYKHLTDPIEYAKGRTTEGNSFDFDIYRLPVNTGIAYVKGVETEFRKRLDFIKSAEWLSHITLFGNGTLLRSHVERKEVNDYYFSYVGPHELSGQANYILNGGLSLSLLKNTFELTASFNKTGDYDNQLGSSNQVRRLANGDSTFAFPAYRVQSRNLLDLVLTQSLFKDRLRLKATLLNALGAKYVTYQDVNRNGKFDDPLVTDLNRQDKNYVSGSDNASSVILGQRTYQLAITYTF